MNKRIGKKRSFFWENKEINKDECSSKREHLNTNFFTKFCKKLFGQCESQLYKKKSSASFDPLRTTNFTSQSIRPKPSLSVLENNISEWKTELMEALDATQHTSNYRRDSVYSHDPTLIGDGPPLLNNKNEREIHHLHMTKDPALTSTIRSVCSSNASSRLSTESQKHDRVRKQLELAAARRNEIKNNRLREQLDSALFETMRMLRQEQYEQQQGSLSYKGKKVYSNSLSSDHHLAINQLDNHQRQPSNND
ncbi:hypothetical protein EDC96DRAFT_516453 [Choanephora cucurbitarum]|nr:hypothetical protein EDC96DRAFT_516453 [Choanephora cucurbitarum]